MGKYPLKDETIGPFRGRVSSEWRSSELLLALMRLPALVASDKAQVLTEGRSRNVKLELTFKRQVLDVVVKTFAQPSLLKNSFDRRGRGSKARRSWLAAVHLAERRVGTPAPVAFLERWVEGRLVESFYVAVYQPDICSFAAELRNLFIHEPECAKFMGLMQAVADGVRAMHDTGFLHKDLGNQNIFLRRSGEMSWEDVQVLDLNRGQILDSLTPQQRARDVSRITLPSDLLRVFKEMYWGRVPPDEFQLWEQRYRRWYALHSRSRRLRHPIREYRKRTNQEDDPHGYPREKDMWIWDERSGQAQTVLMSRDRNRIYPLSRHIKTLTASFRSLMPAWREYRRLCSKAYGSEVVMTHRIGVSVEFNGDHNEERFELLQELGPIPVMVRFYHHKSIEDREMTVAAVRRLHKEGHPVSIALVQDRRAVLRPESWQDFVDDVLRQVGGIVESVEVGHAINRVKWGLWDFDEYGQLVAPAARLTKKYSNATFMGPAAIDFEYHYVLAALESLPRGFEFGALSHHLYVDRRGAPENCQGRFSTLEKCALGRAIARAHSNCGDRFVISEVNWPIAGTGVYSPVGSPYVSPGVRDNDPSVSEEDYARYMIRYLLITICSGFVERVYWWRMVAYGYGLIDDHNADAWRERPAYLALKWMLKTIKDAAFVSRFEIGEKGGGVAFVFRRQNGSYFWIAYTTGEDEAVKLSVPFSVVTDMYGSRIFARKDGKLLLSGSPVFLDVD